MKTHLIAAAAILAAAMPALAAETWTDGANDQKLICKKQLETGSLVKKKKTCLTAEQWKRVAEGSQAMTERMQDESRTKQSGM
jgi:CO/xanthine dehydrogenase Mo-binding subunit